MRKRKWTIIIALLILPVLFGVYYFTLPVFNIHDQRTWRLLFILFALIAAAVLLHRSKKQARAVFSERHKVELSEVKGMLRGLTLPLKLVVASGLVLFGIYIVGSILSSPLVNARRYQQLLAVETKDFSKDISEISLRNVPTLDKDSSIKLGARKMGGLVQMVSQFEVSEEYTQINYKGKPFRVSPLEYANKIKWLTNQAEGIPGYILIDMTSQDASFVQLEQRIKYSPTELFNRNIYRHLRFRYPTAIFDQINFEIDDEGTPYWICPIKDYRIGLFGGEVIGSVVLCNAQTGETTKYDVKDCPTWVDRVFSAEMLTKLYDYHGKLRHGFLNSVLGQKDCLVTTEGYNYLALDDDVWVYTGITSVNKDESIVGFILMNQRTMESRYYEVSGAKEMSAMDSAQGQVQHLEYQATFPLLLNINNEPTYFITLKDKAGLVKMYALVNVEKYQIVATGETVTACETAYRSLLASSGPGTGEKAEKQTGSGRISALESIIIDGNSHYYLMLENDKKLYDVSIKDMPQAVFKLKVGETIRFRFEGGVGLQKIIHLDE
ncbi:MAG: CvpA family protein [Lachnospiraceae bacterium]|nr:CvpA family protein [Lachnospiraceae bacterium]MDY5741685.1 CvpA family protein [Lachnospiraceae bacterium]